MDLYPHSLEGRTVSRFLLQRHAYELLLAELHDAFSAGVTLWELLGNEWLPDLPEARVSAIDVLAALSAINITELEGPPVIKELMSGLSVTEALHDPWVQAAG
eukprot:s968_g3.t1